MPQFTLPQPISDSDWEYYLSSHPYQFLSNIAKQLKNKNRFFTDERFIKLLLTCISALPHQTQTVIYPGEILYRARIYKEQDAQDRYTNKSEYEPFQGYNKEGSGPPNPTKMRISEGRANPEGISYLYLASDCNTAIKEVRPRPHEYVSVAKVQPNKRLQLMDFSKKWSGIDCTTPERTDWINKFVLYLNMAFEKPYVESGDYLLCQYVCEFYKLMGFDGISYNSSISNQGINYTIFNSENCNIISSDLYHIKSIEIEFR